MSEKHEVPLPTVALAGFDAGLSEEEQGAQAGLHRFAREVMRPLGRELDKMPAEQAYLAGSPFWQFHAEALKLGLGGDAMAGLPPDAAARMEGLVVSELAWGDAGLAVSLGAGGLAATMAQASGEQELIDLCAGKLGCWCATQPDRGSDGLILYAEERFPGSMANKGNLHATFTADEVIFNGQTSAWVSNGPVAQVALVDTVADYGSGFHDAQGNTYGCNVIVPLDIKGVSRGKPLEKLGKRPLPQGEIYFDNVRVPRRFAIATRDDYEIKHAMAWAHAGTAMSHIAAGLARAAFEMALTYVHERKQGGTLLANLQLTQYRLGGIGAKVGGDRGVQLGGLDRQEQAVLVGAGHAGSVHQQDHVGRRCRAFGLQAGHDAGVVGVHAVDLDARGLGEVLVHRLVRLVVAGGVDVQDLVLGQGVQGRGGSQDNREQGE